MSADSGAARARLEARQLRTDVAALLSATPVAKAGRAGVRWAGPLISLLVLCAVAWQLRHLEIRAIFSMAPASPLFWAVFALYYVAEPLAEWIIFRRLWRIPVSGFFALARKAVSNEILLGYSGEVYFYAWARRNSAITTAPFGAIKDAAVLSALTGNVMTIAMLAIAAPALASLDIVSNAGPALWSIVLVLATSALIVVFRGRLFSLPRPEILFVSAVHAGRIAIKAALAALLWSLILPQAPLSLWLALAAARLLLSRLPFLPNKDLVFAGLAVALVGQQTDIVSAMALMASLVLAVHVIVGATLAVADVFGEGRNL
jgi:hypothetical protein